MQYAVHEFNDNTIRFVLGYPGLIDAGVLCAAARAVAGSVDVLHASFVAGDVTAYWQINRDYGDGSCFQIVETEGDPYEVACSLALNPVKPEDETQLCCHLVRSRTESALALTISHLCVDGSDGKYLLGKLVEAYSLLADGGDAAGLTVKNGSRDAARVYQDFHGKDRLSLMKSPISDVKSVFPYPDGEPGEPRMVKTVIQRETMDRARLRAKEEGATVNDLLIAACYHGYGSMPGVDSAASMSVMSMMDLRRHCPDGVSEGLCNMSGTLPTVLREGLGAEFAQTLAQIVQQTRTAKEDPMAGLEGMPILHGVSKMLPMGLLLFGAGKIYGSMSLGLTNLGTLSGAALKLGDLTPDRGLFGGPLKKKPAAQVSALGFDGTVTLCVWGQYTEADGELLQAMLDRMAQEIRLYGEGQAPDRCAEQQI